MQLSLRLNDDFKSMDYMNLFNINNIMKKNPIISSMSLIPKTSINDNFTIFISLLKNKVYQVYKKNIAQNSAITSLISAIVAISLKRIIYRIHWLYQT